MEDSHSFSKSEMSKRIDEINGEKKLNSFIQIYFIHMISLVFL